MINRLTDSLAARLSAATYTATYSTLSAEKAYMPNYDLEDMDTLKVSVIPREVIISTTSRGAEQHDYTLSVVLAKRTGGTTAEIDNLLELVENIVDHLRSDDLPTVSEYPWPSEATWFGVGLDPVWSQEHLEERRVFFTAINVQYRAVLNHNS